MPTREEIRERRKVIKAGFDKLVRENAKADTLWYYLNVNGVVIKVDRELPEIKIRFGGKPLKFPEDVCVRKTQEIMLDAGYTAWEPLIGGIRI